MPDVPRSSQSAAMRHAALIEGLRAQARAVGVPPEAIARAERRAREEFGTTLEMALRDEVRRKAYGIGRREIADIYDVPPWLVDPEHPRPRFAWLRWTMRRWWRLP